MNKQLLEAYRNLWSNRSLHQKQGDAEILLDAITSDLKDGMTHPRLRKPMKDKLIQAIKRIANSEIQDHYKVQLIQFHIQVYDKLTVEQMEEEK